MPAELGSGGGDLELSELSARCTVERTNSGVSIFSRWLRKRLRQGAGLLLLAMMVDGVIDDGDDDVDVWNEAEWVIR